MTYEETSDVLIQYHPLKTHTIQDPGFVRGRLSLTSDQITGILLVSDLLFYPHTKDHLFVIDKGERIDSHLVSLRCKNLIFRTEDPLQITKFREPPAKWPPSVNEETPVLTKKYSALVVTEQSCALIQSDDLFFFHGIKAGLTWFGYDYHQHVLHLHEEGKKINLL